MKDLTIGKLAELSGVGIETIRFYQKKGLLRLPEKSPNFRTYTSQDAQRIIFIKKTQSLGFTLSETKELLEINHARGGTCASVKSKTLLKIKEIEDKITNLKRIKSGLEKLSCACDAELDDIRDYKVQECFDVLESSDDL